jgi:glycosyltransferase involved in cell wall biosynthesis
VRRELGIPQDAYLVGSVGRLSEQKGFDILIDAAARAMKIAPETHLLIVGEGPLDQMLRQQAADLGIAQQVTFTGQRTDVERLLQAMDVFACSSRWEGLSTVIMEAMAAGVPIVATDIPGNRELLRHGENAWLVNAQEAAALAEALLQAKQNPVKMQEFARRAKADVPAYGIEAVAARHKQLYQDLLARR